MRRLNYPPVWLVLFLGLAWGLARLTPRAGETAGPWLGGLGWALLAAGIALIAWALAVFRRAGTTPVPRATPTALAASGPYRVSRNPMYLGNLIILAGVALILRAPWALGLVVPLQQVLERLFVLPEEAVLEAELGQPYRDYRARVRRWL